MDTGIIISLSVAGIAFIGTVTHALIRREKKRSIPPPAPLIGTIETSSSATTATGTYPAPVDRDYCDSRHNNVGLRHDAVTRRLDDHDAAIKDLWQASEQANRQIAYIARVSRAINQKLNLRVSSDILDEEDKAND